MSFELDERRAQITERLRELEEESDFRAEWGEETIENLVDLASRGKMVRGALLLEACEAMDGPEPVNHAAAIELVHTGLLIHDDVMDEDEERRGTETIHSKYSGKGEDFGEGVAICAGDITYFLALRLVSRSDVQNRKVLEAISECFTRTGFGQLSDIETSMTGREPGEDGIEKMYREKTASYTFELPLRLASIFSKEEDSEKLAKIGRKLGVLYQIKDDHIELFSNGETGKSDLSDIKQNKKTIHRKKLLKKAENPEELREKMEGETSRKEAEKILEKYRNTSVKQSMREEIESRKKNLEDTVSKLQNPHLQELVAETIEIVVERDR